MKTFTEILNEAAKEVNEIDIFQLKKLLDEDYQFKLIDIRAVSYTHLRAHETN